MASYSWASPISGDWNKATNWSPASVPDDPTANVTIDNPTLAAYLVTIATGENETVNSLTINGTNDLQGSNLPVYTAAEMDISGTLTFGAGSAGTLGGSLQTYILMTNGTIVNPGTLNAFIQTEGNVLLTGTNALYITDWLQSVSGVVTVDTKSIAELTGNTLFDGIFEVQGAGQIINLGGPRQNLIVNIQTIEGPPLIANGWTELILDGTPNDIGEWTGAGYVGIETTLTNIAARGTLDVTGGRGYNTTNELTIAPTGLLNLRAGVVTTAGIDINGGTVQGSGDINSGVINNGTLRALDGTLTIGSGGLVGVGLVSFDFDQQVGTVAAKGGVVEVHGVGPEQTFVMNGDDQLVIDTPISFAGTIDAKAGDEIFLGGVAATSAVLSGQTLLLQAGGATVYSLHLGTLDSYTGDSFVVTALPGGSSEVKVTGPAATAAGTTADDPVAQFTTLTSSALNIAATAPSVFISSESGASALNVSGVSDSNMQDVGGPSAVVAAGADDETFYLDVQNLTTDSFAGITGFQSGDDVTIFGLSLSDFTVNLFNNVGPSGATGLGFAFTEAGGPTASLVLAGYSIADLIDGKLSQTLGTTSGGTPYLTIHAT